jgi:hypothetical protein
VTDAGGGRLLPHGPGFTDFQLEALEVTTCQYGGEYPNCKSAPDAGGTTTTPTAQPNGGGSGGGSGGTTSDSEQPDASCDPRDDPKCEQPLKGTDSTTIRSALRDYLRPDSAIADTAARRRCGEMRGQFDNSMAAGKVFRGISDSQDSTQHYGLTYVDRIHMDPWLLDGAAAGNLEYLREVANTALHEAAHVMGKSHPNGFTLDAGNHDVYSDPYFNLLSPGPNSCIRY